MCRKGLHAKKSERLASLPVATQDAAGLLHQPQRTRHLRKARAYTRNGFDWSERYAGIIKAAAKLNCRSAIIDGEVIVQDENGVSDFEALKSAIRWRPQSLIFCAFDLLHLNGKDPP